MMDCYIFDLEGTLTDPTHRIHHADAAIDFRNRNMPGREDIEWRLWDEKFPKDPPKPAMIQLVQRLICHAHVIILTGRQEKYRQQVTHYCMDHSIPVNFIRMRPTGDYSTPNDQVKARMVDDLLVAEWNILLAFDDMTSVVEMYRKRGITCLQEQGHRKPHL